MLAVLITLPSNYSGPVMSMKRLNRFYYYLKIVICYKIRWYNSDCKNILTIYNPRLPLRVKTRQTALDHVHT
jgi:hypothetical protein